jgi:hypothetical protein
VYRGRDVMEMLRIELLEKTYQIYIIIEILLQISIANNIV